MLTNLKLYREGFNEKVSIGESIEYLGKKYIIIRILEIKKLYFSKYNNLAVRVLVQKVGNPSDYRSDYHNYKTESSVIKRYNQSKNDERIFKVGEIIISKYGIAYEIVSIKKFYYEFVDLVVEYSVRLIVPWSKEEINEALKHERKSTFKVLEGEKK
ncbi:TPA: hypothetical protein J8U80_000222 [Enterococcus faecium]|uniref:Uncharacterized protein n=2 Tax=Enterococcus faecium TaxID=1352 RepID=A0ABD7LMR0_ENTFC|nr:hypothetical protein [Enterococcus faecium]EOM04916.1 hypothetical protein U9Q_01137 [Enterococcus faecium EnGen0258]EOM13420.1 hypothetical protein U9W_00533 [Enterococcus faecium EnGen0261]HAP4612848.1 hypothetical protein [Enterococcus faecalis]EOG20486.1 hypothetical protein SMG_03171 [Enterococcus faecium EnGen0180]EOM09455.1 hypothetical protein U9Y_03068 [Enterococcus faecium EnGen0262]